MDYNMVLIKEWQSGYKTAILYAYKRGFLQGCSNEPPFEHP